MECKVLEGGAREEGMEEGNGERVNCVWERGGKWGRVKG